MSGSFRRNFHMVNGAINCLKNRRRWKRKRETEEERDHLLKTVGQLTVESDFLKKVPVSVRERSNMIEPNHPQLSISKQCELLNINRAVYYFERRESRAEADLEDLKRILDVPRYRSMDTGRYPERSWPITLI